MHVNGKTKLGFFPLPLPEAKRLRAYLSCELQFSAIDPCVGDGAAFNSILQDAEARIYGVEIEARRTAQARTLGIEVLQGTCFQEADDPSVP